MLGSLIILAAWGIASAVWAMHETGHRFTVHGYVRDANGEPVEDAKVMVVDTRIGEGATAFSDRSGYYEVVLHLHNSNLGDEIKIRALQESKTITAAFDPDDTQTERMVQVDFGAPPPQGAEKSSGSSAGVWLYGAGAVLIVAVFLYWGVYSRKRSKARSRKGPGKGRKKKGEAI